MTYIPPRFPAVRTHVHRNRRPTSWRRFFTVFGIVMACTIAWAIFVYVMGNAWSSLPR